jgi:drug/metabolite transporter (DMT)-like permease
MSQEDVQNMESSGQSHRMSIATTIGATIGLIGLVILLYGLFGHADYSRSDGININFWWGLLMVVFGLIMAVGGYLSAHRQPAH